jgi:hypothetical protein
MALTHMVDGSHPIGERGDRHVIGNVDRLRGDAVVVVCRGECRPAAARDHDTRTFGPGQHRHGACDPACPPYNDQTLTFQGTQS